MKKTLFLLPITLLLLAGCDYQSSPQGNQIKSPSVSNQSTGITNSTASPTQKFTDQSYYNNAYLISGDTISPDAKTALSGFQIQKQNMPDGSMQITLKALQPEYHDQQYLLKTGEQLYFIEKFMGDDPNENEEKNLRDDTAVVVDNQGNVVQAPRDFSQ